MEVQGIRIAIYILAILIIAGITVYGLNRLTGAIDIKGRILIYNNVEMDPK